MLIYTALHIFAQLLVFCMQAVGNLFKICINEEEPVPLTTTVLYCAAVSFYLI